MDNSTESYLAFVVLGTVLVVVVGQLLTRGGKAYLEDVFRDRRSAGSVSVLLTVLFYLFALGILGIISSIDVPVTGAVQTVVTKLGVVLLILGIVFGSTMLVLNRIRARREMAETHDALFGGGATTPPAGTPMPPRPANDGMLYTAAGERAAAAEARRAAGPWQDTPGDVHAEARAAEARADEARAAEAAADARAAEAEARMAAQQPGHPVAAEPVAEVPPQRMTPTAQAAAEGHARRGHVIR